MSTVLSMACALLILHAAAGSAQPTAGRARLRSAALPRPQPLTLGTGGIEPLASRDDFLVELLTPSVQATIQARPGTYPVEKPVRLRVTAARRGWRMQVKSTNLKQGKGAIDATEVCMVGPEGELLPLNKPRTVVKRGEAGETLVEIELALVTDQPHEPGLYEGELLIGSQAPSGGRSPLIKVPFLVAVEAFVTHTYRNNKMYFHFGHPDESLAGIVEGEISSDVPLRLTLSAEDGEVGLLPLAKGATPSTPPDSAIPLQWRLRENGSSFREPDDEARDGSEVSWELRGTPGDIEYDIECTVAPDVFQPSGDYGMAVTVTLQPLL